MELSTLLFIILSAVLAGVLIGFFFRRLTLWWIHIYRTVLFKPQMLKLFQVEPQHKQQDNSNNANKNIAEQ